MSLNNVPLTGQSLGITKVPINQNFSVIDTAFSVDHVAYNASGQGKHNKVTLPVQASTPTFSANEEGIYNKQLSGVSEIYLHKQSFAGVKEIPMTNSTLSTQTPVSGAGGFTWLPSGYYMVWGTLTGNSLDTVTLAFPPPTTISNVQLTPVNVTSGYVNIQVRLVDILSNTQFRVYVSVAGVGGSGTFSYMVMGY